MSRETVLTPRDLIVTKTDPQGKITYANRDFCRIADYPEWELLGRPHNLIRHPDMPRGVFELLWKTVRSGEEFFGVVKNTTRSGGFYWVMANVTCDYSLDGKLMGYYSVRRTVPRELIAIVEPLYARMRELEAKQSRSAAPAASLAWFEKHLSEQGLTYWTFLQPWLSKLDSSAGGRRS